MEITKMMVSKFVSELSDAQLEEFNTILQNEIVQRTASIMQSLQEDDYRFNSIDFIR